MLVLGSSIGIHSNADEGTLHDAALHGAEDCCVRMRIH